MFTAIWAVCFGLACEVVEEKSPKFFEEKGVCIEYAKNQVDEVQRVFAEALRKTVIVYPSCKPAVGA